MANAKHYILTSVTLGAIAAASALLIGGANMITRQKIAQNELDKINSGIASIYGDSAVISNETDIKNDAYKYVEHVYEISVSEVASGYAFRNMYGKILLIIGFNLNSDFIRLTIVTNEQTYASTLVDNYIVPLNESSRDLNDVTCGATYGAKLVRDMVNEAKQASLDKVWQKWVEKKVTQKRIF